MKPNLFSTAFLEFIKIFSMMSFAWGFFLLLRILSVSVCVCLAEIFHNFMAKKKKKIFDCRFQIESLIYWIFNLFMKVYDILTGFSRLNFRFIGMDEAHSWMCFVGRVSEILKFRNSRIFHSDWDLATFFVDIHLYNL